MAEAFLPLFIADEKNRDTAFFSIHSRPPVSSSPASAPQPARAEKNGAATACSKPTVTLQKTGDQVTSIKVQCPCGQVIELACVF